ncbi:polysaccharide pyruvyl transferase family protein [Tropicibacter sp. R16_0]|uniref:polysaccharide pyruvyl transferase family protein n=1 Tax=Tropicibacter sp. R16_0 TaxID=2821102 RepID=UPI001ADBECE1|nr:polysaccharide pyruvyl transferase family protein [Tropicibacter sp. R16_0]MBO9449798.1 polysaccharide pyruvyl transferase family protein [Tropicibacter sp. R16_0]
MGVTEPHIQPLRLHWWKAVPNFGDVLSALVVAQVSGRPVAHAGPKNCEMVAIGSLLQVVRRNFSEARPGREKPVVWGTGLLHPVPKDFLPNVDMALVRGPVTAALLGLKTRRFGDAGLLVADLIDDVPSKQDRVALVPHHSQMDDPDLHALVAREPALDLVDPRGDALEVCRRIASSRHVIASSLHGLIVADAFGVPSTWLSPGEQSHLKYHDYAASVGRPLISPIETHEVPEVLSTLKDGTELTYGEGILSARADLIETFPAHLRAAPDSPRASVAGQR